MQTSGASRREIAVTYSVAITREGGSGIPETSMIKSISRGALDTRLLGYRDPIWSLPALLRHCERSEAIHLSA
jgi:hypothetical protein